MGSPAAYGSTAASRETGGSVRVTIAAGAGQGNAGVSLPCNQVWLSASAATVRVSIGVACTSATGIALPTQATMAPLNLPVADVSLLYFYGTGAETIDILYVL